MRSDEQRAAEQLSDILHEQNPSDPPDCWEPRDCGAAQRMHDFDVELRSGRRVAVEVTSDTSGADAAFSKALDKNHQVDAPRLSCSWHVYVSPPGETPSDNTQARRRVQALLRELPQILKELEKANPQPDDIHITPWLRDKDCESVKQLRALGVRSAHPVAEAKTGVTLLPSSYAGSSGPTDIVDVVQRCLPKKATKLLNAKKAEAQEAHLWIWLKVGQPHRGDATAAVWSGVNPDDIPVPALGGVDVVWVAVDGEPDAPNNRLPVYRCDSEGWQRIGSPPPPSTVGR